MKKGLIVKDYDSILKREKAAAGFAAVYGTGPAIPSGYDPTTGKYGIWKRFGRSVPDVDKKALRGFRSFVRKYIRLNYLPLGENTDLSVPTWLDQTHYTQAQKDTLLFNYAIMIRGHVEDKEYWFLSVLYGQGTAEEACEHLRDHWADELVRVTSEWDHKKGLTCGMFRKLESYEMFKHARMINGPPKQLKLLFGPVCKAMESYVFHQEPAFIKVVPVEDRSQYINDMMSVPVGSYYATDYSAFEASFVPELIRSCEGQLYRYLTSNIHAVQETIDIVMSILTGKRSCYGRVNKAVTSARMSGDMCTSLGNGFTNLMVAKYWAYLNGFEYCGVVEGDDGLFRVPDVDLVPPKEFYEQLGFIIKLETVDKLNEGGFCKIFYAEDEPENLRDPIPVVVKAGWTTSRKKYGGSEVMKELARAKGNSLLCETPACPILGAMGLYLRRVTEGSSTAEVETYWDYEKYRLSNLGKCIERAKLGPSIAQREFVERMWGVSIGHQIHIENYFDSLTSLHTLDDPTLVNLCIIRMPDWHTVWNNLVIEEPEGSAW